MKSFFSKLYSSSSITIALLAEACLLLGTLHQSSSWSLSLLFFCNFFYFSPLFQTVESSRPSLPLRSRMIRPNLLPPRMIRPSLPPPPVLMTQRRNVRSCGRCPLSRACPCVPAPPPLSSTSPPSTNCLRPVESSTWR